MPDLLGVLSTIFGLVKSVWTWLENKHFSRNLARQVHELCGREHKFSFSEKALKRWLRSEKAWILLSSLDETKLPEIARDINRHVIRKHEDLDEALSRSRSSVIAKRLMSEFLRTQKPSDAISVHHAWAKKQTRREPDPSRLPPSCWDSWHELHDLDDRLATNLRQLLEEQTTEVDIVAQVVEEADPDHWISRPPHQAWTVIGYYFLAHHVRDRASYWFLKAISAGAPNRAILLARAAWALHDTNSEEAGRLARCATIEQDPTGIASAVDSLLSGSPDQALIALPSPLELDKGTNTQLLGMILKVAALVNLDRRREALDLLRAAVEAHPDRGMLRLALVQTISDHVSTLPTGHTDGEALLVEAADHAATAIPLLRRWNGPTAAATEFACRFYHAVGDLQRVLELGRPPPHGTATADDLSPEVRLSVIVALMMLSDLQSASEFFTSTDTTDFETHYMAAVQAELSEDSDASDGYYEALGFATTSVERFLVLMALARQGVTDLPEIDDLDLGSPEWIDLIRATAASVARDYSEVLRISRPWRDRSSPHALAHAKALYRSGNLSAAIDELHTGADRFRDAHFVALAVELFVEEGHSDRAVEVAVDGLARYQGSLPARWQLRYRVIETAGDRGDWSTAKSHSRALIDEFPDDPRAKWMLIQSFVHRQRHRHAWEVLKNYEDLEVVDDVTAVMKIQLRSRFENTPDVVDMTLRLVADYPDSELVMATAIQGVVSITRDLDLPEDIRAEASQLLPRFLDQFPDSPYLWPVSIDLEDPVESLRPYLEPQAVAREEILRKVRYGEIPIGVLSDLFKEPYTLHCLANERCSIPVNNQELETEAAAAALGSEVVVDTTALITPARLNEPVWVDQHFSRVVIPDVLVDDVHAAMDYIDSRGSGTIGWDVLADRFTARELTPEDIAEARQPLERLVTVITDVLDPVSSVTAPPLEGIDSGDFGHWYASILIAKDREVPLYSDDLVLRNLARSVGVAAFDTYAVVQALETKELSTRTNQKNGAANLCVPMSWIYHSMNNAMQRWLRTMTSVRGR